MIKFLIPVLLASTAVAAAPAAAQWAQPVPQGYAYGYSNNQGSRGLTRAYAQRINRLHQQIHLLGQRRQLSRGEFARLNRDVDVLENRLARASYRGLSRQEAYVIERDLSRLERNIYREARDGNRYDNHHARSQYGYSQYGTQYDRGRDDRNDRDDDRDDDHHDREDHDDRD